MGDNMRGFLMTESLNELDIIVRDMGGDAHTAHGLAGLGDLMTTATSVDSHHYELGCRLARGETHNITGEGVHTLQMIERYSLFEWRNYPLLSLINHLVVEPQSAGQEIIEFAKQRLH